MATGTIGSPASVVLPDVGIMARELGPVILDGVTIPGFVSFEIIAKPSSITSQRTFTGQLSTCLDDDGHDHDQYCLKREKIRISWVSCSCVCR